MIDYHKLKEAIELAKKLPELYCVAIEVGASGVMFSIDILDGAPDSCLIYDVSLDDLITKIRKLTEPDAKYAKGDEVWVANEDPPHEVTVFEQSYISYEGRLAWHYRVSGYVRHWMHEDELYPSREALIKHQIEHWHGLLFPEDCARAADTQKEPEECVHESDGFAYELNDDVKILNRLRQGWNGFVDLVPCRNKCKKCGEFYL